jgi:hypothetical protein
MRKVAVFEKRAVALIDVVPAEGGLVIIGILTHLNKLIILHKLHIINFLAAKRREDLCRESLKEGR